MGLITVCVTASYKMKIFVTRGLKNTALQYSTSSIHPCCPMMRRRSFVTLGVRERVSLKYFRTVKTSGDQLVLCQASSTLNGPLLQKNLTHTIFFLNVVFTLKTFFDLFTTNFKYKVNNFNQ